MSATINVKAIPKKGLIASFLGSFLYLPLGLLPKVLFQMYLLPSMFLNLAQQNLPLKLRYLPGIFLAAVSLFIFDSAFVAFLVLLNTALLGLFNMFYKSGWGLFKSGSFAILPLASLLILFVYYFLTNSSYSAGQIESYFLWEVMQLNVQSNLQMNELMQLSYLKQLLLLYPAAIVILCMISVFIALIFEKSLTKKLFKNEISRENLSYFKVPEGLIWVAIVSAAVAFVDHQFIAAKSIAQNLVLICSVLYYFQGFAILFNFFEVFKVSVFSKVLMVFCLALSLLQVMVVMGLLDYWYNFRARFLKRATQVNERRKL